METSKVIKVMDIRQTQEYANYLKKEGWTTERIENTNYFIKKVPLIGSVLKIQRPEEIRYTTIEELCLKYRVFQVIVEPNLPSGFRAIESNHNLLISHSFKLSKSPYLPSKTLQIDLAQSLSKITANFKKDARSTLLRASQDRGDFLIKELSSLSDLKEFHNAWRKSVKFTRFVPSLKSLINLRKSFSINHPIMLTSHNPTTLKLRGTSISGGAIFVRSEDIAYYWQGFTNNEGRTSLSQYSLVWKGLLWAKGVGCKTFDFEGIYDERFPNKSWLGFTHFKKSFGGKEVLYPGCYTKLRFPYFDR